MNLHPGETPTDHEPIPHEEEPLTDEEWLAYKDATGIRDDITWPSSTLNNVTIVNPEDRAFACAVCSLPIDEDPHDYHDPRCATQRAAVMVTDPDAFDLSNGCRCDGYVHEGCCSVCTIDQLLRPVLAVLEHREEL
jgi:hypothetical protein